MKSSHAGLCTLNCQNVRNRTYMHLFLIFPYFFFCTPNGNYPTCVIVALSSYSISAYTKFKLSAFLIVCLIFFFVEYFHHVEQYKQDNWSFIKLEVKSLHSMKALTNLNFFYYHKLGLKTFFLCDTVSRINR